MRTTAIIWLTILPALAATGLGGSRDARAQGLVPPDTAKAAVPPQNFTTNYSGGIKGDVNQVSMNNRLSGMLTLANGLRSLTTMGVDDAEYRIEDRSVTNKSFTSSLFYPMASGLVLTGGISDTRSFNRLITSTGFVQNFINNVQSAEAGAQYNRALPGGLSLNGSSKVAASRSEQTFEDNRNQEGAASVALRYARGAHFDATARGFFRLASQESESGSRSFSGLGASEDSVIAQARLVVRDSATVKVDYSRFTAKKDYLDIPRTSQGGLALSDTVKVTPEEETRDVKNVTMTAETKPMRGVKLKLSAQHSDAATYFAKAQQRTGRDTGDQVTGELKYSPGAKTTFAFDFETREILRWLGPQRTGHYNDENKRIGFSWTQTITKTLRMTTQAGASLVQTFYLDPDQDGDRDQRYRYANVRLASKLVPRVDATVYVNVSRTDYVKIRASQSANNRRETIYEFRPEFTYKITDRVDVAQKYGLNIQFADYVFQENENFLDRIVAFSNLVRSRLTQTLGVDFSYAFQLHDRGSYLRPEPRAARVLVVNQEERRDEVKVSFRYKINKHLTLSGANDYSRRKDLMANPGAGGAIENGGVEVGIDGGYDLGSKGKLKLSMKRVKRFGRFNAAAQNDYWVMDSSIEYRF